MSKTNNALSNAILVVWMSCCQGTKNIELLTDIVYKLKTVKLRSKLHNSVCCFLISSFSFSFIIFFWGFQQQKIKHYKIMMGGWQYVNAQKVHIFVNCTSFFEWYVHDENGNGRFKNILQLNVSACFVWFSSLRTHVFSPLLLDLFLCFASILFVPMKIKIRKTMYKVISVYCLLKDHNGI